MGYLSPIFLEAKFGASTRTSEANFGTKPPPRPPDMEVPPRANKECHGNYVLTSKEQHWRSPAKKVKEEKTTDYEADRKNPEVWKKLKRILTSQVNS